MKTFIFLSYHSCGVHFLTIQFLRCFFARPFLAIVKETAKWKDHEYLGVYVPGEACPASNESYPHVLMFLPLGDAMKSNILLYQDKNFQPFKDINGILKWSISRPCNAHALR